MKWLLIGFVRLWRSVVSPWYGPCCKYYPTCSAYALEALQLHGAIKGSGLAIWRLLRCNPWSKGGVDPVPGSPLQAKIAEWWSTDEAPEYGRLQTESSRVIEPAPIQVTAEMG